MDPALYAPLENKPLARSERLEIDDLLSRASRGDTQACLQVGQLFARGEKFAWTGKGRFSGFRKPQKLICRKHGCAWDSAICRVLARSRIRKKQFCFLKRRPPETYPLQ